MNTGVDEQFQGANIIDAGKLSPYWGEHVARYVFAMPYVDGKTVLDIACGTGYGLGFLKEKAVQVTGVDANLDAATKASKECRNKAAVILGDGRNLPFGDENFDIVTSFETIEHVHERDQFLKELSRVLKPEGTLLLSTPNAIHTKPVNGRPSNPFHVFEYTPEEFRSELQDIFQIELILGQSLDESIRIPPFYFEQQQLPKSFGTQTLLLGWKIMNKLPLSIRETLSNAIWKKPFYPTEYDYLFSPDTVESAPVQVAVCRKR